MSTTYTYYQDSTGNWWTFNINTDGSASTTQATAPLGDTIMAVTYSYYEDSSGQWWAFSINPDGSANTSPIATPGPGPIPPGAIIPANITSGLRLIDTMEWAKRFIGNRSTAIGNYIEPAIGSADIIMQTMISAPFRWRWNRCVIGFITTPGQQDYYLFNWKEETVVQLGWVTVDYYGNSQQVIVAGTTGSFVPNWSNTLGGSTTDGVGGGAAVWQNLGSIGVPVSTSYDFGWIETASVMDTADKWWEMEPKISLTSDSSEVRPRYIAAQGDDGTGNISFRVMPIPDAAYPVTITIQQSAPLFTSTQQTWYPIPDTYWNVYSWGFLAIMLLFADDPRFQLANQKFVTALLSRNQGLDQSEVNVFLNNWQEITGQPVAKANMLSQGIAARGQ
jgi:hypothetical protein